jgi:very-short-patch-repair endonuclease
VDIDAWLRDESGVVRRSELLQRGVSDGDIEKRVRAGDWSRVFRGVLATHLACDAPEVIACRAALLLAGTGSYLSCLGAAVLRRLAVPLGTPIHVSIPANRYIAPRAGFRAHRDAAEVPPSRYRGLPSVSLETALVQAFGCVDELDVRRSLVIDSVREGFVSVPRVLDALAAGTRRRSELLDLLTVCEGSQSEAEIAMLVRVIRAARLPEPSRQLPVSVDRRSYRLDLAYAEARVAIEVDGKAWHFNARQRNHDIRRDAELATQGWLTLRFTYEQIKDDPQWVVRCISAALHKRTKIQ